MTWTIDLTEGLGQHLAAHGIGVWRTTGLYDQAEIGITIGAVPQTPPAIIALTPYPYGDDPAQADSTMRVQVRYRSATADPRESLARIDAVFDLLHGATALTLGGVTIHLITRTGSAPMGLDPATGRYEHSDTYELTVFRPSAHRN